MACEPGSCQPIPPVLTKGYSDRSGADFRIALWRVEIRLCTAPPLGLPTAIERAGYTALTPPTGLLLTAWIIIRAWAESWRKMSFASFARASAAFPFKARR